MSRFQIIFRLFQRSSAQSSATPCMSGSKLPWGAEVLPTGKNWGNCCLLPFPGQYLQAQVPLHYPAELKGIHVVTTMFAM
eukprot:1824270-Amphidinium_carterae.1